MIPGSGIFSGAGAIGGADIQQNPDYGQDPSSGVTVGRNPMNRNKFRDALMAASKYKDQTDYKARKEAKEKEKAAAQRQTMKISDDISVMEGYTDPGFTLQGQQGRSLLGPVGAAVGVFNPAVGAGISAVGNLTGY
jgi:hypothetical protein